VVARDFNPMASAITPKTFAIEASTNAESATIYDWSADILIRITLK